MDRQSFERALSERLLAAKKLDAAGLDRALRLQSAQGDALETILYRLGLVSERDALDIISAQTKLPVVQPEDFPDAPVLAGEISARFLRKVHAVPIAATETDVVVAMADPLDTQTCHAIALAAGKSVIPRLAAPSDIELELERLYNTGTAEVERLQANGEDQDEASVEDESRLRDMASEAPVIRLVNQLIARAVEQRASDIHIEPFPNRLVVRYRIDGLLRDGPTPPGKLHAAIISRIKIMAKMNIAERRLPQDGRIKTAIRGKDYDLRVATLPTVHGEGVTIRILDSGSLVADFGELGLMDDVLSPLLELLARPQGILLVTGPTGSGKTTTLYTCLSHLNNPDRKLVTVEDPVEYQLEGVLQVPVRPKVGLGFAEVLRTLLRHNPDIIMIGEMRDLPTAQIAIQASLTGHLVFSTLHTNNAASSVTRLLDMNVEDYLITSTLNGVLAQRLVRRLCPACRQPYEVLPELARRLHIDDDPAHQHRLYAPVGCDQCEGTGYRGRTGIYELLIVSDEVRRLILARAEAQEIHRAAVQEGMRTMYEDGIRKALLGMTTLDEVLRVTRDTA
jgi:general secretion pathway protein E